ncbi:MAG: epimerase [Gammaproteobacteria bacterium SG8_11]|nr:MAG: epimerase [Gammaproteobacteria bacterium SG8_11]
MKDKPIFVAGASGYVGGRLVPMLLEKGHRVRALARSPEKISCRPWGRHPQLEVAHGDVLDRSSLEKATVGCGSAFYLVHSMIASKGRFAEADRLGAVNMSAACESNRLEQIIYLGGLGDANEGITSKHLRSRHEVGEILQAGAVPVTTLRAAMILGSGSASFEIMRYLVENLPVMTTPRWVHSPNQPIAISNVLNYLIGCLEHDQTRGQTYDIGGPDVLTYRNLLDMYAELAELPKRWVVPVPVLTPRLSSYWIHLVTPVPSAIARPLTEGLTSAAVCRENRIISIVPQKLLSCREAIRLALDRIGQQQVDTCWLDAGRLLPPEWAYCGDADYAGGTVLDCSYRVVIEASAGQLWPVIARIGGDTGWYFANRLWRLRGWIDRLIGGIGLRRGRRHPAEIYIGDALDFWRVLSVQPGSVLTLLAEMKLPGEAILEFRLQPKGEQHTELQMISRFLPAGLWGQLYWYSLYFAHRWLFAGMLQAMARAVGRPVVEGPQRFDPRPHDACRLPAA